MVEKNSPHLEPHIERLAAWLHENSRDLEHMVEGYEWPLHDNDDGYRGDGAYVRLIPKDIAEHHRDFARRTAEYFAQNGAVSAQPAAVKPAIQSLKEAAMHLAREADAEIERLKAKIEYLQTERPYILGALDGYEAAEEHFQARATTAEVQVARLSARVAELEGALKPFAELPCNPKSRVFVELLVCPEGQAWNGVQYGPAIRAARAALQEPAPADGGAA